MAGYKTRSRNAFKDETVYFGDRSYKKVMIYDKTAEIVAKTPLRNRFRQDDVFDILARHGYYFPRYEFKLADRQALALNKLDIHSVADLEPATAISICSSPGKPGISCCSNGSK